MGCDPLGADQPAVTLSASPETFQLEPFPSKPGSVAIVIFGPPGSGKGTQASLLGNRLSIPHISTGDMLCERILRGDAFGKRIAERIDVGQFVPDAWIDELLDERLSFADCRTGYILDGYPRTNAQAERFLADRTDADRRIYVVRLLAEARALARRFAGRRQCDRCGALFHLELQPSLAGNWCDRSGCEGQLIPRADDREEFLARRLKDYEDLTRPVLDLLVSRAGCMLSVDADDGSPAEIHERIWRGLRGERQ